MKKVFLILFIFLFSLTSCSKKKEKSEELTPLNAPAKYGETLGRALKKAEGLKEVIYLRNKINTFQIEEGRYPNSLEELVEKGYIDEIPRPPKGMEFVYDPKTGSLEVR
ncbi:MAG: hypothetical protein DRP67_04510 [Candidatus Omnitrophota bacterium]|nr:MAG: hypothetical protein DRP67_04510 [Candidatus Omnitrophota bacterium]HDN97698.1 hypothetical protein [bacterium]